MIKIGQPPYLECSTKGDKRFSPFYARPRSLNGKSIEEAYQAMKVFSNGETGLNWREAKGRLALNQLECEKAYKVWWEEYIIEKDLLPILKEQSGLSEIFGKEGRLCQATVLWEIRNRL